MATDATGTPTTLGIPTYNPDNDAPSGLGFNAAMAEIDLLIRQRERSQSFNVLDYSAVGNGIADDTAAIANALAALAAAGGGILMLPPGKYRTTAQIDLQTEGTVVMGAGEWGHTVPATGATQVYADHTAGSVFRVWKEGVTMHDFTVTSSATRYAGAAGSNYGIRVEASDTLGPYTKRTFFYKVRVTSQPNHGLLLISDCTSSQLMAVTVDNIVGHGIVVDSGAITSRTGANRVRAGIITILGGSASRCTGHGLIVGNSANATGTDIPYRVYALNLETFYNASDAAMRLFPANVYVFGENIKLEMCGLSGKRDPNLSAGSLVDGIYMAGRHLVMENNRYVNCEPNIARVDSVAGMSTQEVFFRGGYIDHDAQSAGYYNPAINVAVAVSNITVEMHTQTTLVTTLLAGTSVNYLLAAQGNRTFAGNATTTGEVTAASMFIDDNPVSIANVTAGYIQFSAAGTRGVLVLTGNTSAAGSCAIAFRVGDGNAFTNKMYSGGATVDASATAGVLTGTTGTSGHLTIRADSATNRLYIENQTGGLNSYVVTLIGLGGGTRTGGTFV